MKVKQCSVCKEEFLLNFALKYHIYGKARDEAYQHMINLFKYHTRDFKEVSRQVLLRQMPHFNFVRKNIKEKSLAYLKL